MFWASLRVLFCRGLSLAHAVARKRCRGHKTTDLANLKTENTERLIQYQTGCVSLYHPPWSVIPVRTPKHSCRVPSDYCSQWQDYCILGIVSFFSLRATTNPAKTNQLNKRTKPKIKKQSKAQTNKQRNKQKKQTKTNTNTNTKTNKTNNKNVPTFQ